MCDRSGYKSVTGLLYARVSSEADVWQPPPDIGVCQSRQPPLLIASLVNYNVRVNTSVHNHRRAAFVLRMMES